MKKKNGFVFVETMIVVVILIVSLLVIYSSYMGLISNERRLSRYDDPAFIYKTYSIAKFLLEMKDEEGNVIIGNKITEEYKSEEKNEEDKSEEKNDLIYISINDNDLFYGEVQNNDLQNMGNSNRKNFFSKLYNDLNVQTILIVRKNQILNEIDENKISSDLYKYLKSIDVSDGDENEAYIVVMYAERVDGSSCDPNQILKEDKEDDEKENKNEMIQRLNKRESTCTFYYSSLKLTEEIVNG